MNNTLQGIRSALSRSLLERDEEVDVLLVGLVAHEHTLLVGPPGTAKSQLCRSLAEAVTDLTYCERLLSPTTPPEAIFGPVDLSALRDGRYEHIVAGSVVDCHLLFLDEFFRASDAIRDSLLHLLGPERQCLVGTQQVRAPLISCVGAANSWSDSADQAAILDRWLLRKEVRPVSPQGRETLAFAALPTVTAVCDVADIEAAHQKSLTLPIAPATRQTFCQMLRELAEAGICPSDRRVRKSIGVVRAAAVIQGSAEVLPYHLEVLGHVLWDDPSEQPQRCSEIVSRLANPVGAEITQILADVDDVVSAATDAPSRMAAVRKVEECEKRLSQLSASSGNGRAGKAMAYVRRERVLLQAAALGIDPEKAEALL